MASSANKYGPLFQAAAQKYGVPPNLLIAQAQAESSFNPNAVSPTNAQGLMQIEPSISRPMESQIHLTLRRTLMRART